MRKAKLFSLGFLSVGVFLLAQIIFPVISFKLFELGEKYNNTLLISPSTLRGVLGVSIKDYDGFSYFYSASQRLDQPSYDFFTISIPKLRIDHAKVMVDSNNFSQTLAQLPGSAMPGEKGNLFISGHSALRPVLSIQNAIFAKLPDIKKGDSIVVEAGGTKFNYQVIDLKVVDPSNISVIAPPEPKGRYISLMTCVPPGLNYKRLIVVGKLL